MLARNYPKPLLDVWHEGETLCCHPLHKLAVAVPQSMTRCPCSTPLLNLGDRGKPTPQGMKALLLGRCREFEVDFVTLA